METALHCIKNQIEDFKTLLHSKIDKILAPFEVNLIIESMRYMCLAPAAKCLRPFLLFASSQIFNVDIERILPVCASLELLHVYSLIHDDLPQMDNDDYRRGQFSCHKKFSEAIAILTGDALLTLSFEILSKIPEDAEKKCKIIEILSTSAGYKGMIGGQTFDIRSNISNFVDIRKLHIMKSAMLFSAACEIGAVMGRANDFQVKALKQYGKDFGCAFQIKDDIQDFRKTENSILNVLTLDDANLYLDYFIHRALNHLRLFFKDANILHDLTHFIKFY